MPLVQRSPETLSRQLGIQHEQAFYRPDDASAYGIAARQRQGDVRPVDNLDAFDVGHEEFWNRNAGQRGFGMKHNAHGTSPFVPRMIPQLGICANKNCSSAQIVALFQNKTDTIAEYLRASVVQRSINPRSSCSARRIRVPSLRMHTGRTCSPASGLFSHSHAVTVSGVRTLVAGCTRYSASGNHLSSRGTAR